jgi:hypothetical protein
LGKNGQLISCRKKAILILLGIFIVMNFSAVAYAEWHYGIGTGPFRLNAQGDQGLNTTIAGPVQFEVDLDPEDVSDVAESAFGFGGYATDGTSIIQFSVSNLKLEAEETRGAESAKLGFEKTGGEITVAYPVYRDSSFTLRLFGGVRYTKHELSADVTSGGSSQSRTIEHDWIDALVGLTLDVPLADKWNWGSRLDAGFGVGGDYLDSEGTYSANTGVTWRFYNHWSGTLYGKYTAVNFENDSIGDPDWYLYDVDESGVGLTVLYNF